MNPCQTDVPVPVIAIAKARIKSVVSMETHLSDRAEQMHPTVFVHADTMHQLNRCSSACCEVNK
jgi:hypothetical protein